MLARIVALLVVAGVQAKNTTAWPSDATLISMTKTWLAVGNGYYSPFDNSTFAPDFVFRGPDIGPLNFEDNYKTLMAVTRNVVSAASLTMVPFTEILCASFCVFGFLAQPPVMLASGGG